MGWLIETQALSKTFPAGGWRKAPSRPAVYDVNLQIAAGELFGLLGPNGAGKTTLTKMLATLILPTSGTATIVGHPLTNPGPIRAQVGLVVTDERSFYWRLTAWQNLQFFCALYGLFGRVAQERMTWVLQAVELQDQAHHRFADFSTGMKQRIAIARALLHRPQLLFLDEPSRSLDPTAMFHLHQLLRHLVQNEGVTIFLITHNLPEAEQLCGRVAIMHQGRVQAVGGRAELRQNLPYRLPYTIHLTTLPPESVLNEVVPGYQLTPAEKGFLLQFVAHQPTQFSALLTALYQHQITVSQVESHPLNLEELFRYYTQENIV